MRATGRGGFNFMKMKPTEANGLRCTACEIVVMLYEAKQLAQLRLLAAHVKSAIDRLKDSEPPTP